MVFPFKTKSTPKSSLFLRRVVYTPSDLDPVRTLLIRLGMVIFLFVILTGVLWLDREGLQDHSDGHLSLADVVYFTMVTVTTVGYGDIVPVTPRARLIDALVVTPVRIFIWIIFLGTAYQLALRQFTEVFRMAKLQSNLDQHVVVCGFGHTGYSAVKELLAKGTEPEHIVVIDPRDDRVQTAVELGVVALKGDATQEGLLQHAAFLSQAKAVIISSGRDDTNALILLTVKNLNTRCRVIVSAKEEENVKLFRQGGAQTIISPATYGGYMLAAAVDQQYLADYLEDFLTAGGQVNIVERMVEGGDVGKTANDLQPDVLLRVYRHGTILSPWELQDGQRLETGDVMLLFRPVQDDKPYS
ncbi:MAG: potassium channel family protein [Nitrospirota bacterium]|nr:MAG: potassium channel family protein [Nitrospirota bacterium]